MNRETFLQDIWLPYPSVANLGEGNGPKSWVWGRLVGRPSARRKDGGDSCEIFLLHLDKVRAYHLADNAGVIGVRRGLNVREFLAILKPGDWVALSTHHPEAQEVALLAPCLREAPAPMVTADTLREWAEFRRQVEDFFSRRGFLQVSTPTLVSCPGTEVHLQPFETTWEFGSRKEKRFLPTSPELSLKKLLAQGYGPLFEIRSCFRNGELSPIHEPEFQMLEWYRPFADLAAIRDDVRELLRHLSGNENLAVRTVTMSELFSEYVGFSLQPQSSREELVSLASRLKLSVSPEDSWDDLFFRIFVDHIEPKLVSDEPLLVEKYPPSQAALARLAEDGWGDRFELYWRGCELANAYHELTDPQIQRARIEQDILQRRKLNRAEVPRDEQFLSALEAGMPPSAGIALGLERLFLVLKNRQKLAEIRLFAEGLRVSVT